MGVSGSVSEWSHWSDTGRGSGDDLEIQKIPHNDRYA